MFAIIKQKEVKTVNQYQFFLCLKYNCPPNHFKMKGKGKRFNFKNADFSSDFE